DALVLEGVGDSEFVSGSRCQSHVSGPTVRPVPLRKISRAFPSKSASIISVALFHDEVWCPRLVCHVRRSNHELWVWVLRHRKEPQRELPTWRSQDLPPSYSRINYKHNKAQGGEPPEVMHGPIEPAAIGCRSATKRGRNQASLCSTWPL